VALVQRICRFIEGHLGDKTTLDRLAAQEATSKHQLQRVFKRVMGITPRQYAEAHRLTRLKTRLREGKDVTHALYEVGFGSSSRLYERSNARLGMTPATYRRGGRGMQIHYAIIPCSLGRLLVAATERGVCAVHFGDSEAELRATLQDEFPAAKLEPDGATLRSWVEVISAHLSGQQIHIDLPLDVRATAFQWRVWEALRTIPYGQTRSYSDVARAVGNPKAVRAVANACASNPVPIVIPCHRVIRSDGSLGGYGGGVERKRALLTQERTKAKLELSLTGSAKEPVNA
jgi:AraC family transcriptional regulator of adaptative response/methylated-DNA-[protein]-cysteine methyltransferase